MRLFFAIAAFLLGAPAGASSRVRPLRFHDYPAAGRCTSRQVYPKLKPNTDAWLFRTRIREAARRKPNFAGHYVLAVWGCGSSCIRYAVINSKTGKVIYAHSQNLDLGGTWDFHHPAAFDAKPVDFRLNSRLLVLLGSNADDSGLHPGPFYYKLEHEHLIRLR